MVCVVVLVDYYSAVLFPPESEETEQTVFRSWGVNCCSRWGSFCSRFILLFCFLWFQKKQKKQCAGYLFCSWWCVVACEFYSAVLILTVPEQSEQTGWCVFYHFAKEVAVGGFFWGVLFFCSDSPRSEQSHTRGSFRCIGTSEAGLLFCWIRLFFCSVSYGSRTNRRNEPTPTGDGVVVLEPFILLFRFAGFRTIRTNGLLGNNREWLVVCCVSCNRATLYALRDCTNWNAREASASFARCEDGVSFARISLLGWVLSGGGSGMYPPRFLTLYAKDSGL